MASRAEEIRDLWAVQMATITIANGYNNDMVAAQISKAFPTKEDQLTKFPHIAVELGDSDVVFHDSKRTINDELMALNVAGYVKADTETAHISTAVKMQNEMEYMVHDLKKKICTDLLTGYVNNASNPWNVELRDNRLKFRRIGMLGIERNLGMVTVELVIRIRNQNSSFTAFDFSGYLQDQSSGYIFDQAGAKLETGG